MHPPGAALGGRPARGAISTCLSELLPQEGGRWCPAALPCPAPSPCRELSVDPGPSFQPQLPGQRGHCESWGLGRAHHWHLLPCRAGGTGPTEAPTRTGCLFIALSSHCRLIQGNAPGVPGGPVWQATAESPKQSQKMSFGLGCHPGESQELVGGAEKRSKWPFLSFYNICLSVHASPCRPPGPWSRGGALQVWPGRGEKELSFSVRSGA